MAVFRLTRLNLRDTITIPASGTPTTWFQRWWQSVCEAIEGAVSGLQQAVTDIETAQATAEEAGAVETYTVGVSAVSGQRVLMTVDATGTVQHADPTLLPSAARIVGISVGAAYAGAPVEARWLGVLTDPGFAWDLTKRIFCGLDGALTQTPPASGFSRCVGSPITPTSMRVHIDPPLFLIA